MKIWEQQQCLLLLTNVSFCSIVLEVKFSHSWNNNGEAYWDKILKSVQSLEENLG